MPAGFTAGAFSFPGKTQNRKGEFHGKNVGGQILEGRGQPGKRF